METLLTGRILKTQTHTRTKVSSNTVSVGGCVVGALDFHTQMAKLTLFPVMLSFFVRNDACKEKKKRVQRCY